MIVVRRIGKSQEFVQIGREPWRIFWQMHLPSLETCRLRQEPRQFVPFRAQGDRPQMAGLVEVLRQSPAEFGLFDQIIKVLDNSLAAAQLGDALLAA